MDQYVTNVSRKAKTSAQYSQCDNPLVLFKWNNLAIRVFATFLNK